MNRQNGIGGTPIVIYVVKTESICQSAVTSSQVKCIHSDRHIY